MKSDKDAATTIKQPAEFCLDDTERLEILATLILEIIENEQGGA